jgi:serine/threonine-protein kinase
MVSHRMSELDDLVMSRAEARVGKLLRGKWRLDGLLGIGGMAAVYAATHRNGMRGAVKMLHMELGIRTDIRNRFLREGYVANKVGHHGAVQVLDDDVAEDGSVFLVMELLEGKSVDAVAASLPDGRMDVGDVLAIVDQLLDVIAAAHDKGIIHRDLKPENLFLTRDGLKVLDFGIARLREPSMPESTTSAGVTLGTPAFMPPEQALGNTSSVDARTDLWAVGATMFTLLTGRYVHEADTALKLLIAAGSKSAPKVATVAPGTPPSVCAIVDRALGFEQEERWPSARAMQEAIREARVSFPAARVSSAAFRFSDVQMIDARAFAPTTGVPMAGAKALSAMTATPVSRDASAPSVKRRRLPLGVLVGAAAAVAAFFVAMVWSAFPKASAPAPAFVPAAVSAPPLARDPKGAATTTDPIVEPLLAASSSASSPAETAAPTAGATGAIAGTGPGPLPRPRSSARPAAPSATASSRTPRAPSSPSIFDGRQ